MNAGEAEAGERIVSFIHEKGYRKIDYLIATHPHADHIGGMKAVVQAFEIGEIYMPKASTNTKTYENLLEAISEKGLKIKTAQGRRTDLRGRGIAGRQPAKVMKN